MTKINDIHLYHDSFISLHVQLHNQLRQVILSGRWAPGTRIPSENQLTKHFNISRSTVRLALQQVELECLIERIPGKGTFVAQISHENKSHLLAFVTCGFDAENHLLMLNGAEREAKARGYQIVFSNTQNLQEEIDILQQLKAQDIAGILLWPNSHTLEPSQKPTHYQQVDVPIVLMDRRVDGFECDFVTSDNYGGAQTLMQHLVKLGHRHIVFLSHTVMEILPVMERYRAYCNVLEAASLTPMDTWLIGQAGDEISASYALQSSVDSNSLELQQIRQYMLNARPRPTAIFALNDYIALLAMRAMKLLAMPVPDVMSIAGFDDTNLAMYLEVPLTTVAQDPFMLGKRAAQLLIDRLEGDTKPTSVEIIPTQLRIRSSTAAPAFSE
jgi:GntR family transcriptional regulator, arabinose operon transcriptional repressor